MSQHFHIHYHVELFYHSRRNFNSPGARWLPSKRGSIFPRQNRLHSWICQLFTAMRAEIDPCRDSHKDNNCALNCCYVYRVSCHVFVDCFFAFAKISIGRHHGIKSYSPCSQLYVPKIMWVCHVCSTSREEDWINMSSIFSSVGKLLDVYHCTICMQMFWGFRVGMPSAYIWGSLVLNTTSAVTMLWTLLLTVICRFNLEFVWFACLC